MEYPELKTAEKVGGNVYTTNFDHNKIRDVLRELEERGLKVRQLCQLGMIGEIYIIVE